MENLEDINVGDKVILANARIKRVESVQRMTKTLVWVGHRAFRKKDGLEYGGRPFETMHICKVTPEVLAEIESENKRNDLINKIVHYPWGTLSTEELENVYELINK